VDGLGELADAPAAAAELGEDLPSLSAGRSPCGRVRDLLRELVILPDFPAGDRDLDQRRERDRVRGPAQEVADRPGVAVLSQERDGVPVRGVVGREPDHGTVVVLSGLGGLAGAHALPHAGLYQAGGVLHGEAASGGQGHLVVRADGQDVAGAALTDRAAQAEAAVDLRMPWSASSFSVEN
jgi:hypothetical protein